MVVDSAKDLGAAHLQLHYDPKLLQLNGVTRGALLAVDGQHPEPIKNVMNESGSASIDIARASGSPGVTASGTLLTLQFQAVAKGTATVETPSLELRNSQGQLIARSGPQLTVNIK